VGGHNLTPWDPREISGLQGIWERKENEEYVEPEYVEEEEEVAEQGRDQIWIEGSGIDREIERQATIYGK
jgi:hypothetical protein